MTRTQIQESYVNIAPQTVVMFSIFLQYDGDEIGIALFSAKLFNILF